MIELGSCRGPQLYESPCTSARRFISNLLFIREEREIGMGSFEVENKVFYSAFSLIEYTWHRLGMAAHFHVTCSLSFCSPRLWVLVGMGTALEKSPLLQPSCWRSTVPAGRSHLVVVMGKPGWSDCYSGVAHNSQFMFRIARACVEKAA